MSTPWPASGAVAAVPPMVVVPRTSPIPSTRDVLARAMAQSQRRGARVARWRTARRWTVYHAWRHALPVVLALLAPSSQYLLWQGDPVALEMAQAAPPAAATQPVSTPEPEPLSPVLALSTQLLPVPALASTAAPLAVPSEPLNLRADSSLHSQEP